jgi:argininosuccinate synthase
MPKCVLAFSGSQESLLAIPWLKEHYDLNVVTLSADVGGDTDLESLGEQALMAGAVSARIEDLRDAFFNDFITPALRALAHYQTYLLGTALSRPLVARELVRVALEEGATHVAHGSSIRGNDQVRLETAIQVLAPHLKILSPQHEWELKTPEQRLQYARSKRISIPAQKDQSFRYDLTLWGQAIKSASFEDPAIAPPEEAYTLTCSAQAAPNEPQEVSIEFHDGLPVGLDGQRQPAVKLIGELNAIAGRHGIGRADLIEDRLIGFKSREVYEAPGATVLHIAKRGLEQMTLSRESLQVREGLSVAYGRCVYNGQWFSDLREALDSFFECLNRNVAGSVTLRLYKGTAQVIGRFSECSLYAGGQDASDLDHMDNQAARGFIKVWSLPLSAEAKRRKP